MKTVYHFTVPRYIDNEDMRTRVLDAWVRGEHVPYPCDIIRIAEGDNLVIDRLPEGQDLEEAIQLVASTLNTKSNQVGLVTYEGLVLQRCGSHHYG